MQYSPKRNYYPTNPIAAICEYYDINWDTVWSLDWHVPYETTIEHSVQDRSGKYVHISLYRMPSGNYEAVTYRC